MSKLTKKINKVIGGMMLASALITTSQIYANNTTYSWSGNAPTPGTNLWGAYHLKTTDSSTKVNYTSGSSEFVGVSIFAKIDGVAQDVTCLGPYYDYAGVTNYVEVVNVAYESNQLSSVNVRPRLTTTTAGNHYGNWTPDV